MRPRQPVVVRLLLAGLAVTAVLAACTGQGPPAPVPDGSRVATPASAAADLEGSEWALTSLGGRDLLAGSHITLAFAGGQATGFAGCNGYGGEYAARTDGSLAIPMLAVQAQLCPAPDGVMAQESAYIEALTGASAYRLGENRLEIDGAPGQNALVFARMEKAAADPGALPGSAWHLVAMDGSPAINDPALTLVFYDEHVAGGRAGCRGYVATYKASSDRVRFPMIGMTGEACPEQEAIMAREGAYTDALTWATGFRLDNGQLEIRTARGEVLAFAPLAEEGEAGLEGSTWVLEAFVEARAAAETGVEATDTLLLLVDPLAGSRITAAFEAGTVSGSTGCNDYGGEYALDGVHLTVGPLVQTEMACLEPAGIMDQEGRYLEWLGSVTGYHLGGGQLVLGTDDGQTLIFVAGETPL